MRGFWASGTLVVIAMSVAFPGCGPASIEGEGVLVIRHGTLIDGTGATPRPDAVVVVRDGRIAEAGAEGEITIPSGATVVDADGGAILPGLVDTHTHLLNGVLSSSGDLDRPSVEYYLESTLDAGVTSFRDAGSRFSLSASLPDLRASLDALGVPLPTIVATGPIIAAEGSWVLTAFASQATGVADVPGAVATVNRILDGGVDQIKIMVDAWGSSPTPTPSLSAEQIAAITDAAHDRGAWVVAHVTDIGEARLALDGGVDELTHWPGNQRLPDDLIGDIVGNHIPLGTTYGIGELVPFRGDVRRVLDAGGTIVLGTDAPGVLNPANIWQEMQRMVQAGMTPMEAIIASTRDAARALELQDVGTIEAGMLADLVIVDGNPLDDITSIAHLTTVIKAGVVAFQRKVAGVSEGGL